LDFATSTHHTPHTTQKVKLVAAQMGAQGPICSLQT